MGEGESQELSKSFYIRQTTLNDFIYISFFFFSQNCLRVKKNIFIKKHNL